MLMRDLQNKLIPLGKTSRTIQETFLGISALPAWLTVTATGTGSSSIIPPDQSSGGIRLMTGTVAGDSTMLNMFPAGIGFQYLQELVFDFDSMIFGSASSTFRFELLNAAKTAGVVLSDDGSVLKVDTWHPSVVGSPADTELCNYRMIGSSEFKRKRNLRIRVQADGTVAIGEHSGDIEHYFFAKTFESTKLQLSHILLPKVGHVARNAGVSLALRIPRVAVTLVHH